MSFRKIEAPATAASGTGVKATIQKKGDRPARLMLTLGTEALKGFSTKDPFKERWRVMIGEGEDEGRIAIYLDRDGEFVLGGSRGGGRPFRARSRRRHRRRGHGRQMVSLVARQQSLHPCRASARRARGGRAATETRRRQAASRSRQLLRG